MWSNFGNMALNMKIDFEKTMPDTTRDANKNGRSYNINDMTSLR